MAHVSNTMDLATQPATTGSNGLWRSPAKAFVVVALGVAIAMGASIIARSNVASGAPAADHSYDKVEGLRGAAIAATPIDRGYDNIAALQAALSSVADRSYAQVESLRGATGLAGATVDHRNDDIELLRAARRSIAAHSFDKFQVPHGAVALP